MRFAFLLVLLVGALSACTSSDKGKELKSPCVAANSNSAEHPCGPRRRVNDHWLS